MLKAKKRIFQIIEISDGDFISRIFDLFIISLILLNVFLVFLDTFTLPDSIRYISRLIETASVAIFSVEYILRFWTSDLLYPKLPAWKARLHYFFSFMALIDILAIIPFFVPLLIPVDLRVLRILRVVRMFRLFKMNRYTNAFSQIVSVFKRQAAQLFSSLFVVFLLIVVTSVIMYHVENAAQPENFSNAFSGMWWAVATLTTVGYGDIYPVTAIGKVLSAIIALLGIGLVAVPTGIISAGFMEQIKDKENESAFLEDKHFCPYCGKKLDD